MSQAAGHQRAGQDDNMMARALHKIYRGNATLAALALFIGGLVFIALGSMVHGDGTGAEIAHHLLRDIGIAGLISALLGSTYEYLLRSAFIEDAQTGLKHVLDEEGEKLSQFRAVGLESIHDNLDFKLLQENFAKVTAKIHTNPKRHPRIRILDTWTGFYDAGIMRLIEEAASAGCKVDILLLDPRSPQVAYRAKALGQDTDYVKGKIKGELKELGRISSALQEQDVHNLEARVYDSATTNHVYDFDGAMVIGLYWRKRASFMGPQFELVTQNEGSDGSRLGQLIGEQFDELWELSETDAAEALRRLEEEDSRNEQAYVIRVQLKSGNLERRIKTWQESLIPILKQERGFEEALVLGDHDTNSGISITLWESEEDIEAALSNPEIQRRFTQAADVLATPPEQSAYDVLIQEQKSPQGPM